MKYILIILASITLFFPKKNETLFESNTSKLKIEKDSLIIYGIIKDNSGESFKFVNIQIQNSNLKIKVNENGTYKLDVFKLLSEKKELIIEFSFLGYKIEKRKVKKELFNENNILEMNIKLKEDPIIIKCYYG